MARMLTGKRLISILVLFVLVGMFGLNILVEVYGPLYYPKQTCFGAAGGPSSGFGQPCVGCACEGSQSFSLLRLPVVQFAQTYPWLIAGLITSSFLVTGVAILVARRQQKPLPSVFALLPVMVVILIESIAAVVFYP